MSTLLDAHDQWLKDTGPAALVIREFLMSVEGNDGVVFPATFAASEDRVFKGGYNIDLFPDGSNICLIDSVGSQANRIEPIFAKPPYAGLIPQIIIKAGEGAAQKTLNLLHAGHRAGDAIARCSSLKAELQAAFKAVQAGDFTPLAQVAPTSIVFGAWDSRDTQAKVPRLVASTIRAFNVRKLTRSAQYVPAMEYVEDGLLDEPADDTAKKSYAERGFVHVPAPAAHGGIIADGGIRRDATLHLAALRLVSGTTPEATEKLQRYILGLALVALVAPPPGYLRQGCNLVRDPDPKKAREFAEVSADGARKPLGVTVAEALEYARTAAKDFGIDPDRTIAFGVGKDREVPFDVKAAKQDAADSKKSKRAKKSQ
jgi:CRISPR-associated protein Csb1